jgi:hypothetical protein
VSWWWWAWCLPPTPSTTWSSGSGSRLKGSGVSKGRWSSTSTSGADSSDSSSTTPLDGTRGSTAWGHPMDHRSDVPGSLRRNEPRCGGGRRRTEGSSKSSGRKRDVAEARTPVGVQKNADKSVGRSRDGDASPASIRQDVATQRCRWHTKPPMVASTACDWRSDVDPARCARS